MMKVPVSMPTCMEDILQGPNLDEEFRDFQESKNPFSPGTSSLRGERLSNSSGHL